MDVSRIRIDEEFKDISLVDIFQVEIYFILLTSKTNEQVEQGRLVVYLSKVKDDAFHDLLFDTICVFLVGKMNNDDAIEFADFVVFGQLELEKRVH